MGARTLFDELARLASPEVELTVSEFADSIGVVAAESGSPFPAVEDRSRALSSRAAWTAFTPIIRRGGSREGIRATGKSELGVSWFAFIVDRAPGPC